MNRDLNLNIFALLSDSDIPAGMTEQGCPTPLNLFATRSIIRQWPFLFSPQSGDIFIENTKRKRPMPAASHWHLSYATYPRLAWHVFFWEIHCLNLPDMKVQEMIEALRHDKPLLSEKFGVEEIAIFGSYARSEQREDSDIDFLVQLKEPKLASLVGVMEFLEGKFKRRIDIVAKHKHLSKRFWNIVGPDIIYV